MHYKKLLFQSRLILAAAPATGIQKIGPDVFRNGAGWMATKMSEIDPTRTTHFDTGIPFTFYGMLKYGIALCMGCAFVAWAAQNNAFLLPLSIVVFYFFEVHFLFLFPLLIDNVSNPLRKSIKHTYRIGIFRCMITVIFIGFYMLVGLLKIKAPLHNWHIGCLAILIWYKNEVRDRP